MEEAGGANTSSSSSFPSPPHRPASSTKISRIDNKQMYLTMADTIRLKVDGHFFPSDFSVIRLVDQFLDLHRSAHYAKDCVADEKVRK
jgi:hypothetical protein